MKLLILLATVALTAARPDDSVYENIDSQAIFTKKEKLIEISECFRGVRECTPLGSDLKSIIPDALETDCSSCTLKQKKCISIFVVALRKLALEEDLKLKEVVNPIGKYDKTLSAFLEKYGHGTTC